MKPDKITKYGLLEVCEFIPGKRGKVAEGAYCIMAPAWTWKAQ